MSSPWPPGGIALLMSTPRVANVRAKTSCDLFVLNKADFSRILRDHPQFAKGVLDIAKQRYNLTIDPDHLTKPA